MQDHGHGEQGLYGGPSFLIEESSLSPDKCFWDILTICRGAFRLGSGSLGKQIGVRYRKAGSHGYRVECGAQIMAVTSTGISTRCWPWDRDELFNTKKQELVPRFDLQQHAVQYGGLEGRRRLAYIRPT